MTIGEKIKTAREAANLTQTELGKACGTTKQTIYKYETGTVTNIPLDRLELIAQAVHVPAAELMGWAKEKTAAPEDDGLAEYLEMLRSRPECRMLFSVAKDATKADVEKAVAIIEALRKTEESK